MPNKTKQNTKNSTEQICSQPLYKSQTTHHTHPRQQHKAASWLRGQPPQEAADAHTVLNVNPTVCSSAKNFLCPTQKRTHTHHPHQVAYTCRHKKTNQGPHPTDGHHDCSPQNGLPRKEVIQPHLPVRLPCYDFVPIANPTFDHSPRKNG